MKAFLNFIAGAITALAIVTLWLRTSIDFVVEETLAIELKHGSLSSYYQWWNVIILTLFIFCVISFVYELGASANHNLTDKGDNHAGGLQS